MLALVLGMMPALARSALNGNEASVLAAKASVGTIESTLAGGGILNAEDPIAVQLPATVEVTGFLVKNGDRVEEGQPIATVDRVTLLGAMTEVQQSLNEVAKQMKEKANTSASIRLSAPTAGRVKAVYAAAGDDVRQTMLQHGALAVLSLDGMMAAEVETELPVRAGESVTVVQSDGKELPGRVETALEGILTVVLTDDSPKLGDSVTIYRQDGNRVGAGNLYPHSAWTLLATDGVVSYVHVRENQQVWQDSSLFSLQDLGGSAEYQALSAKHGEYEEMLQQLFSLYSDDMVKTPSAGFISGIDETKVRNTAAGEQRIPLKLLASEAASGPTMMLVNGVNGNVISGISVSGNLDISNLSTLLDLLSNGNTSLSLPEDCVTAYGTPAVGDLIQVSYSDGVPISWMLVNHMKIGGLIDDAKKAEKAAGVPSFPNIDYSGMLGGFSIPVPGASVTQEEDDGLYQLDETTILSVTPDNAMMVSISVDELDILDYKLGMTADVMVNALPDRSFTASVTEIGAMGDNAGGNSKYSVKLRLERAPDMLDGMNASVVVHRGEKTALLLPSEAVSDRGSRSYVYTELDSKTGKPTAELSVTTGISDGINVEILTGLTEGQTVYYEYYSPKESAAA